MSLSIWDKIDDAVAESLRPVQAATTPAVADSGEKPKWQDRNWKLIRRLGDLFGTVLWVGALAKLLIFDYDVWLIEQFAPSLKFLLDFKFLVFLATVSVALIVLRRNAIVVLYVLFFPAIVLFWKIPRLLYRLRSWNILLGVLNGVQVFFHRFRRNFLIRTIELICAVLVVVSDSRVVLVTSVVVLFSALIFHYSNAVVRGVRSSRFLNTQQRLVGRLLDAKWVNNYISITDSLKSDEIEKFDKNQLNQFATDVSGGLLLLKGMDFYAFLLRKYRRSNAGLIFAISSFLWLLFQSLGFLTLANYGLWKTSPAEFKLEDGSGGLLVFIYYSLTSLYANTIPQISADGPVATTLSIFSGLYGPVLLLALLLQLFFGYRQSRDDAKFSETISSIRSNESALARRLEDEYETSPDEAMERLHQLGLGASSILIFMATRIPSIRDDEEPPITGSED